MENIIFKNKKANEEKLLKYGFENKNRLLSYSTNLYNNEFKLEVEIKLPDVIKTKTIEISTGEIYTLHLTNSEGEFVGKIREEYKNALKKIADSCFDTNVFKFEQSKQIIEYVKNKYNDEVEYLWEKFPDNAVARRKDNKKWYLAILTVEKCKFGFKSKETVEVVDLKADKNEVPHLIKQNNVYEGYHMNKKSWVTIILDNSMKTEEIQRMIDKSYVLAGSGKNRT